MDADLAKLVQEAIRSRDAWMLGAMALMLFVINVIGYFVFRAQVNYKIDRVNRNFKNVLDQQSLLAETTGRIEEAIKQESILLQIRADQYFEKHTEAIQETYNALLNLRNTALEVAHNDPKAHRDQLLEAVNEFRAKHDTNRIWLPGSLAKAFEDIAVRIDNQAFAFIRADAKLSDPQRVPQNLLNQAIQVQEEFYDFITEEIPEAFEQVIKDVGEHVQPISSTNGFNSDADNGGAG